MDAVVFLVFDVGLSVIAVGALGVVLGIVVLK